MSIIINSKLFEKRQLLNTSNSICQQVLSGTQPTMQFLCCQDDNCVIKPESGDCPPDNRTLTHCQKTSDLKCCNANLTLEISSNAIINNTIRVCDYNGIFCLTTTYFSGATVVQQNQINWMLSRNKWNESRIGSYACCDTSGCILSHYIDEKAYIQGLNYPIFPQLSPVCSGSSALLNYGILLDSLCNDTTKFSVICPDLYQSGKCRIWGSECENPLLIDYIVEVCNETRVEAILDNNIQLNNSPPATLVPRLHSLHSPQFLIQHSMHLLVQYHALVPGQQL
ncbi:11844_t:CDS:1 [Dentiscutata erythropus]|uniref:11844_t:CDS:1 n=1 Tax=Dentiscutata erythropus TaxID=1348616 RepID=A0A9N9I368_9GLOM|nr:11844_t:CDS:1 [Dentiscutata erythropus]